MSRLADIENAAYRYVVAKVALTKCMQKHFRQLCNRCKHYDRCDVYATYVDSWINLQKAVNLNRLRATLEKT